VPGNKLTSIIILASNQLEYTKLCIESIYRYTNSPFELILVDNGSTDGTADYFDSIVGAKVIKNKENQGFAKGCNQGIEVAEGDYILLLNNDTIVAERWLDNLIECLESDASIGIVGPKSNYTGRTQLVEIDYDNTQDLHKFACEFNRQGPEKWFDADVLAGFCMLIRREVFDKIGNLDERFHVGTFEDDDLCARAKMAGYRLACAGNTFVYHFGGRTFVGNQLPYDELYEKNMKLFNEKWQLQESKGLEDAEFRNLAQSLKMAMFTRVALAANEFKAEWGGLTKLFHQGLACYIDGKYDKALQMFQELSQKLPSSIHIKRALGLTLMMLGKFNEAKPLFVQLLEERPDDINLLLTYSDCLVGLGELNTAENHYRIVLEQGPSHVAARMGLVVIEKVKSQPELLKFIKDLEALINLKTQLAKELNERLSVTYLTISHRISGGSKVCFEQINRLIERGHNVHVISHWSQPDWFNLHTEVKTVSFTEELHEYIPPESDVAIATFWSQIYDLIKNEDMAHVYFAQGDPFLFEKDDKKRTQLYEPRIQWLADLSYRLPISIFTVSEGMRELIQKYYGREVTIIPNAIDLEIFKPSRRRKRQKPKLLMIGEDGLDFKGFTYINEAFQRIKRIRDVEVIWVSPKQKTSIHIKCDTFIQAPSQQELARIYADCDIFVSASIYESFSLPPIEAMACGTPAVVAINEGTKGYAKDGKNCLTVPICDSDAIFTAVNRLLDDELLRERVIKGGLETASRYNWKRAIDILEERLWNLALSPKIPFIASLPEEAPKEDGEAEIKESSAIDIGTNDYYYFQRPDIIKQVPAHAKRILDVGCAAGIVGKTLKERSTVEVVGIEVVEAVAREAEQYLDRVIIGDVERLDLDFEEGYFDCIILSDVLEHLYNPWQVLAKLKHYLAPDGTLVCSIPNVGHISILRDLLRGSWKYEEAGILDITHLRFFTLEGAFALLMSAGFKVENVDNNIICNPDEKDFLDKLYASGLVDNKSLQHATVYQFLLTAMPSESGSDVALAEPATSKGMVEAENLTNDNIQVSGSKSRFITVSGSTEKLTNKPKLSLAMIVKDEADNLGRCLNSVQGVVDEIVVVDTGSSDNTVEIAEKFGAKVIHYKWHNDFSAARNVSLEHSTGEWVMFLDADEELVREDIPELKKLLEDAEHEGFFFNEFNFVGDKEEDGVVVNLAFRLWRNKPEYRFSGAIHEQIVAKVQSQNQNVGLTGIRINHYGYLNKATKEKNKVQRNLNILIKEAEKHPDDSFTRFNLGVEYLRLKDHEKALDQYKKAFANLTGLNLAYASMLIRNIALCLKELGRHKEALKVLKDAKEAYPDYTDLFYLEGLVYLADKDVLSAIHCFETCLDMGPAGKTHISRTGTGGYIAANSLANAYRAIGNEQKAVAAYEKALRDNPIDCITLSQLGLMLVHRERPNELKRYIESLVDLTSEDVLLTLSFVFNQGGYYDISLNYLDNIAASSSNPSRAALLRGECLLNLKRYQDAVAELVKVPESSQYFLSASASRAVCHILLKEYKDAIRAIDLIKDNEDYYLIHYLYGSLADLLSGKSISLSVESAQKKNAQKIIADLLRKFLELEEFEIFEEATGILEAFGFSPGEKSLSLGKIYYDVGYNELAIEELISAHESGYADGEAFFILGLTAFNNEFYEEAKTFFFEALNSGIKEITLYISLARTLIKLEENELAFEVLDMGTEKHPDSPLIAEVKQSVKVLV